jgi:DNA polymerase-4/DNA polymerase V
MKKYEKAIVHIDADAFFASCEQALHPAYRNKPVVVGAVDRGIATALSYEAKRCGVRRGMTTREIQAVCPEVILLPGNYEAYTLFSKRLFSILRRFTDQVEEYSIDEGFMDITGLEASEHLSYKQIAEQIKKTVQKELNITVSVGLAPTKVLAKLASTAHKPNGFGVITQKDLPEYLRDFLVNSIWGIGPHTADYMRKLGIFSAYDFAICPLNYVQKNFTKPHHDIWHELNGIPVYPVISEQKNTWASISKTSTFKNGRMNKDKVFAELLHNIENACEKARNYTLSAQRISIFLKTNSFKIIAREACLTRASAYPMDLVSIVRSLFDQIYEQGEVYRATGVILSDLQDAEQTQADLFESSTKYAALKNIYRAVDTLTAKFGKYTVRSGGALKAETHKLPASHGTLISIGTVH